MNYLYPPFQKNIQESNLIAKGDIIIAAFSGGKDSLTLLLLLKKLQKDLDFKLRAAYFNHHIRQDAQSEEKWVKNFCDSIKIELEVGGEDVPAYKNKHKLNLENAASLLRSRFLKEVAAQYEHSKVATAHTKSDLAETFFIKLLRGSGSRGLSAIYSRVGKNVIRPLLIFSQKDILSFLKRNKIRYYRDYTNEQNRFLRNKIRHILIPEIEKIEPDIDDRIFKTVTLIRDEYDYFKGMAAAFLNENLILNKILPVESFVNNHLALQRHILREYIRLVKGDLLAIDFEHVENIITGVSQSKGIAIPGVELRFHKGYIYPKDLAIPGYEYPVNTPATVQIREIDRTITIEKINAYRTPASHFEIVLPYSSLKFPLTIRSPRKEDKYKKLNSSFELRVFEMIREAGFPPELRILCPVIINGDDRLIWVAGSPAADAFKVMDKKEEKLLRISCTYKIGCSSTSPKTIDTDTL